MGWILWRGSKMRVTQVNPRMDGLSILEMLAQCFRPYLSDITSTFQLGAFLQQKTYRKAFFFCYCWPFLKAGLGQPGKGPEPRRPVYNFLMGSMDWLLLTLMSGLCIWLGTLTLPHFGRGWLNWCVFHPRGHIFLDCAVNNCCLIQTLSSNWLICRTAIFILVAWTKKMLKTFHTLTTA